MSFLQLSFLVVQCCLVASYIVLSSALAKMGTCTFHAQAAQETFPVASARDATTPSKMKVFHLIE
jgi:hypothetical protein